MLEGKEYRAADLVLRIVCGLTDGVTAYMQSLKMTRAHDM